MAENWEVTADSEEHDMVSVAIRGRPFTYSHTIGLLSLTAKGFSNPVDMAVGENGVIYVLNRSNSYQAMMGAVRVTICNIDADYIGQFGGFGQGDGQLTWPTSIARDSKGNLYVSDEHRHDVQVFDKDGNFLRSWGSFGSGVGQLDRPSGLAVERDDNVLVVDHMNNRIQRFSPDGRPLAAWGSPGSGPGQFNLPWGICSDAEGNVYVADWRNDRVQKFDAAGKHLCSFGTPGSGPGQLYRPANVGVDDRGNVYVADWGNDRIVIYTREGFPLDTLIGDADLSKWGTEYLAANTELTEGRKIMADGTPEKRFWGPTAVDIDASGHVFVVDSCRHRVQIYDRAAE
jgi:DNA-binding beta-propeller fold protein YncE